MDRPPILASPRNTPPRSTSSSGKKTWPQWLRGLGIAFLCPLVGATIGAVVGFLIACSYIVQIWSEAQHVGAWIGAGLLVVSLALAFTGIFGGGTVGVLVGLPLGLIFNIVRDGERRIYWAAALGLFVLLVGGYGIYKIGFGPGGSNNGNYKVEWAAKNGDLQLLKEGLREEHDLDKLLVIATRSRKSSPEVVEYLLEQGADVNYFDVEYQCTPLHFATREANLSKDYEVVKVLLQQENANVEIPNNNGETARYLLTFREIDPPEVVELLEEYDAAHGSIPEASP